MDDNPVSVDVGTGDTAEPARLIWVLYRLRIDGERGDTLVTVPIPTQFSTSLSRVLDAVEQGDLLPVRIDVLHGDGWLAGRAWSVASREVIPESRARALFPDDPAKPGRSIRA